MSYNGTTTNGTGFSQTSHLTNSNYVTSQALSYAQSIAKFDLDDELVRPFGTQDITGFLEMQGNYKATLGMEFYHVEEDYIQDIVKGASSAGAGAGNSVTFTQTTGVATSVTANPAYQVPTSTSNTTYMLRDGDICLMPDGALAYVSGTASTTAACTLTPLDATVTLGAVIASNEISVVGQLNPEGGDSVAPSNSSLYEYKNTMFTTRETHVLTGAELGNVTWFNNLGENGNESKWYHEAIRNTKKRFDNKKEMFNLIGTQITNDNALFTEISGSQGLIPWMVASANVQGYNVGSWAKQDLKDLTASLNKYEGAKENTMWAGYGLMTEIDDVLGADTALVNGGVIYSDVAKDRAVAFEFDSFSYGGYTFHKKHYETLDKPWGLGNSSQKYTNYGLVIPTDNVTRKDMHGRSESVPAMRLRYHDRSDSSMGTKEWVHGGAGNAPTNGVDKLNVEMQSTCSIESFGGNRFGLYLPN